VETTTAINTLEDAGAIVEDNGITFTVHYSDSISIVDLQTLIQWATEIVGTTYKRLSTER
jgi:hypothetical protein